MGKINDIFRQHADAYINANQGYISDQQRNVINAIVKCRTGELGYAVYQCPDCHHSHCVERSCGNRHCPGCQGNKTLKWLQRQLDNRLPCNYFMLTFTVPEQMRDFIAKNQQQAYSVMFEAATYAIKKLSKDKRYIGCETTGFCAILHTWGRQMQYHPHIHIIIPAGGIDLLKSQWLQSNDDFFLPVRALSKIYRGRFKEQIYKKDCEETIPPSAWKKAWNVHCEPIGSGEQAIKYVARYVFRVAISDERILEVSDSHVTISYKKVGSERKRRLRLTHFEFIRRFLLHVLPAGFQKVRHYGFMSPNSSVTIDQLKELVKEANDIVNDNPSMQLTEPESLLCPNCVIPLRYIFSVIYSGERSTIVYSATG